MADVSESNDHPDPSTVDEPRVSTLELFFDLVFVFAFTQVTLTLADDTTWTGLLRGILVFFVLWVCWDAYAWLTNALPAHRRAPRVVVLVAMTAMLFVALAVPGAFDDDGRLFAVGWLVAMGLHGVLFALARENPASTRAAIVRLEPANLAGGLVLFGASYADGGTQTVWWVVAVAVLYVGPYVSGVAGFTIHPGHFAERHRLIVIIALGESIVAIGVGTDYVLDTETVLTGAIAMVLVCALWWAHFDTESTETELALTSAAGPKQARVARDLYSYLHQPLVLGVILAALGLKKTLGHVHEPLGTVAAVALCGGVAAYLAGLVAIRRRRGAEAGWVQPAAVAAVLGCLTFATSTAAWVTVAVLAALTLVAAVAGSVPSRTPRRIPGGS
jgi:low temperature requirement protein LtrA